MKGKTVFWTWESTPAYLVLHLSPMKMVHPPK
jgi:hypothetical protein